MNNYHRLRSISRIFFRILNISLISVLDLKLMVEGFPPVLGHLLQISYFVQMTLWSCWICDLFVLSKVKQSSRETHSVMGNPCFRFYNLDILQILLWPTGIKAIMSNSGGNILKYLPQRQTFSFKGDIDKQIIMLS